MRFRNRPLPYWLDYVRHAAGNVCPVVLVQNQCDTPLDEVLQPPIHSELLQTFPYLQQIHYSAKVDRKRDSLNEALREAIHHLRSREGITTIGKGRMKLRLQFQKWLDEDAHRDRDRRQHRTLTQQQFQQLCSDVGDISSPDSLLDYLHAGSVGHDSYFCAGPNLVPVATVRITDPPRPADERQACVSYAWKEERSSDPERAGKVEEFCARLEAAGIYAAHWKSQRDEICKVIDEHGVDVLGQTDLKHFRQIQDFAHHVNEMLAQIADVLQPREFDRYIEHAIDEY